MIPKDFTVVETTDTTALVPVDPYREAERSLDAPATLEVAWNADNWDERALTVACALALPAIVFWAWFTLGVLAGAGACLASGVGFAWLVRRVWDAKRWIRVDGDGIRWRARSWLSRPVIRKLPSGDIAQVFVRDVTDRNTNNLWPKEVFRLFARDRSGIDHPIVDFPTPENGWWLEERIEHHLGIPDRKLAGELAKPLALPEKTR